MIEFIIAVILFSLSSYGWGRIIYKYVYPGEKVLPAFCITLGLAILIFTGGILNVFHIAHKESLYILFFAGLVVSFVFLLWFRNPGKPSIISSFKNSYSVFLYVIPVILFVFLIFTLIPTHVLNHIDDFTTYIMRPVRMMQTGTLAGNPFSMFGIDSLGGQAFLQAFILSVFPISYLNGFDSIFCMVLCTILIIEMAGTLKVYPGFTIIALLSFISINPFIVNLSSVYSGSLMIIAIYYSTLKLTDALAASKLSFKETFKKAVAPALLFSALLSLKTTYVIFAGFFFLLYLFILLVIFKNRIKIIAAAVFTAGTTLFLILPWIVLSLPKYSFFFKTLFSNNAFAAKARVRSSYADIFSYKEFFGHINFWDYNFVVLILILASLCSVFFLLKKKNSRTVNIHILTAGGAGILSYFTLAFLFLNEGGPPRYATPILIATLPVMLLLISHDTSSFINRKKRFTIALAFVLLYGISVILPADSLLFRVQRLINDRTTLNYPLEKNYVEYTKAVIEEKSDYKKWITHLQSKTEQGKAILAWISEPFYLDFSRNPIFSIIRPHTLLPRMPDGIDWRSIQKFLEEWKISYVIWGYNEPTMLTEKTLKTQMKITDAKSYKIHKLTEGFIRSLKTLSEHNKIIYDDGLVKIIKISQTASLD